jgi:GRAM domain-containing protein 4
MALNADSSLPVPLIQHSAQASPSSFQVQASNADTPLQCTDANAGNTHSLKETQESESEEAVIRESWEEDNLSEEELRQLYDDEEIDRFLHLFSAVRCIYQSQCLG